MGGFFFALVIPAQAGGAFQQPKAGHPATLRLVVAWQ